MKVYELGILFCEVKAWLEAFEGVYLSGKSKLVTGRNLGFLH